MLTMPQPPQIQLPKGWQGCVKSAVLYAIGLAHYSIVYARAWAADSINARVRLAAENDRLHEECSLLCEELRLKDTRVAQIPSLSAGRIMGQSSAWRSSSYVPPEADPSNRRSTPFSSRRPRLRRG